MILNHPIISVYASVYSYTSIMQLLLLKSGLYVHFQHIYTQKSVLSSNMYRSINGHFGRHLDFGPSLIAQSSLSMLQCTLAPIQGRFNHWNQVFMCIFSKFIPKKSVSSLNMYWKQWPFWTPFWLLAMFSYLASQLYICSALVNSWNPRFAIEIRFLTVFSPKLWLFGENRRN